MVTRRAAVAAPVVAAAIVPLAQGGVGLVGGRLFEVGGGHAGADHPAVLVVDVLVAGPAGIIAAGRIDHAGHLAVGVVGSGGGVAHLLAVQGICAGLGQRDAGVVGVGNVVAVRVDGRAEVARGVVGAGGDVVLRIGDRDLPAVRVVGIAGGVAADGLAAGAFAVGIGDREHVAHRIVLGDGGVAVRPGAGAVGGQGTAPTTQLRASYCVQLVWVLGSVTEVWLPLAS